MFKSKQFNDIYFSEEDGFAETIHTFIEANDIFKRISENQKITVGELGFGTGLNFLTLCDYIQKMDSQIINSETIINTGINNTSKPVLEFWSVEKYPLTKEEIEKALSAWDNLSPLLSPFLKAYPDSFSQEESPEDRAPIEISLGNFRLHLFMGDVQSMISRFPDKIDCWFLDGFAPEKNPEMWSAELFQTCYNKTAENGTASTFTSAGFVKRNLREAGFFVKRLKGFGKKRHMVKAFKTPPS